VIRVSSPVRGKRFFCSPKRLNSLWDPPSLLFNGYRGSFLGVKRRGREVDHSPPFSAEGNNEWSCTANVFVAWTGTPLTSNLKKNKDDLESKQTFLIVGDE
jgi:hypothetical protein